MQTMTTFEKEIFRDIRGLPPAMQKKIAHLVHLIRNEFISTPAVDVSATEEFLATCGKWKDDRSVDEQLHDLYSSRCSTERTGKAF
ncbi:hypothetical protein [Geobacter argillaceus]|uniref:DUF2281 domain-containing protein n=1 Tax=Geobacter argillaceus TaxID=345631 RepID=A0A562VFQ0_9BACT|nr:hypothetical protein [Geobacter argillaceus]TWJ16705.1 hypothetical protein JN12_03277 [Geobacter argillaceus]